MVSRWRWSSLLLFSLSVQAAEPPPWHTTLSSWTRHLGAWLDARLSGQPNPNPNPTRLSLGLLARHSALYGPHLQPQVDLQLVLPQTQKRLALIITRELSDATDSPLGQHYGRNLSTPENEQATFLGMRQVQQASQRLWQSLDAGLVSRGLNPGLYVRWYQQDHYPSSSTWQRTDKREIRWESLNGWLLQASAAFDRALDHQHLWRLSGQLGTRPENHLLELNLGTTLFIQQSNQRTLTLQLLNDWRNQPGGLYRSRLRLLWSRTVGHRWSLLTIIPEVRIEQRSGYRLDPVLSLRWMVHFNDPSVAAAPAQTRESDPLRQ